MPPAPHIHVPHPIPPIRFRCVSKACLRLTAWSVEFRLYPPKNWGPYQRTPKLLKELFYTQATRGPFTGCTRTVCDCDQVSRLVGCGFLLRKICRRSAPFKTGNKKSSVHRGTSWGKSVKGANNRRGGAFRNRKISHPKGWMCPAWRIISGILRIVKITPIYKP